MVSVPAVSHRPWLEHYDPGVPRDLEYPEISLPELLARAVQEYPDRVATKLRGATLTYRRLAQQADAFAAGLQACGIRPGERVALMLPNIPQFIIAFFGALKAGAVVVPTNPLYTAKEMEHQLADSGATALVILDQFFEKTQTALAGTRVRTVICASVGTAMPLRLRPLYDLKMRRDGVHKVKRGGVVVRFEDVMRLRAPLSAPPLEPDDLAVLQYTGGTTGRSKGAMLTHRNLIANAVQAHLWQGVEPDEPPKVLCIAPFFHVYGLTVCMNLSIVSGATMILVPRFVPEEVAQVIARERPQLFPGVPTMYVGLYSLPGISRDDLASLTVCLSGAMPLPPEVQRCFEETSGSRVVEGYGLTEASPVTHSNPVLGDRRPGTVGLPFPGTDAMITNPETWEPLPPGEVGEMTVRGPQVMRGYWNRPEETAAVLRDGWLHTGDLATMDDDGYFRIVDRKKDMIIVSGFNVYPREVEDVLYAHPKVLEAAVVGDAHDYKGESVRAVVAVKEGHTVTAEEVIAHCREHLAPFKVPKTVEFRTELPKSLVGKVLRRELK